MRKNIYAIRDRLANDLVGLQMYTLFVFRTDPQAIRYFADAILGDKSILAQHPSDYDLVRAGEIDDNGIIYTDNQQHIVITGDALVASQTPKLVNDA